MSELSYFVDEKVFKQFPDYICGVVIAYDVKNGDSPAELIARLRAAEEVVRQQVTLETLTTNGRIAAWREAFRKFGAKPSEFRSSIEAMARRTLRNQELPSINALVDIGNVVSLRHLVPTGGHAIDVLTQDIALRPATGTEDFVPFGEEQVEHPAPGEIIFTEGDKVLTRRWTWRQANHTLTLPETTAIEFNVDALPPVSKAETEDICREVMELIGKYCGGQMGYELLTREHPRIGLGRRQ